jgi:hypothetical protein
MIIGHHPSYKYDAQKFPKVYSMQNDQLNEKRISQQSY